MRKCIAVLALIGLGAGTASAQSSWNSEFGIQGGYARIVVPGTGTKIDAFDLPGFSISPLLPTYNSLFAILPYKDKIAIEPSLSASQGNALGDATLFNLGLRADYALTPKVYAAAGATLHWVETGGVHETQLGVQAALGYRLHLVGALNARLEAHVIATKKAAQLPPADVYALLFGVSHRVGGAAAAPARRAASPSLWAKTVGVSGGYTRTHGAGGLGDITNVALPGWGAGLSPLGLPLVTPPTVFAIFPIGRKIAIEPGMDLHRVQSSGTTVFGGNFAARLDYAVHGGWYGAAGGNLAYFKATGANSETLTGANVAWGYRFHLTGNLGGRFEANYTMMGKNDNLGVPALNTLGLMFSTTMALR